MWQTASVSYVVGKYPREITRNKTTKLPSCIAFRRLSLHVTALCANTGPYCQDFYFIFAFKDFSETSLKSGAALSFQTPLFPPHRYFCTCWTVLSCVGRGVGLGEWCLHKLCENERNYCRNEKQLVLYPLSSSKEAMVAAYPLWEAIAISGMSRASQSQHTCCLLPAAASGKEEALGGEAEPEDH